jgi:predicted nucleic-acid-binding protein
MTEFLNIDDLIKTYKQRVKKAEKLKTTDNKHYVEKRSVLHWLYVLKAYINPSYALAKVQTNTANDNIYNDILLDSIGRAIGVSLDEWQREYIITGKKRMNRETMAIVIRQLLDNTAEPMDLTTLEAIQKYCDIDLRSDQKDCFADVILTLHNRLENAGIPVRQVKTSFNRCK